MPDSLARTVQPRLSVFGVGCNGAHRHKGSGFHTRLQPAANPSAAAGISSKSLQRRGKGRSSGGGLPLAATRPSRNSRSSRQPLSANRGNRLRCRESRSQKGGRLATTSATRACWMPGMPAEAVSDAPLLPTSKTDSGFSAAHQEVQETGADRNLRGLVRDRDLVFARAYCGWPGRPPMWLIEDALTRAWMEGVEQGRAAAREALATRPAVPVAACMKGTGPRPGRRSPALPSAPGFARPAEELREHVGRLGAERVAELLMVQARRPGAAAQGRAGVARSATAKLRRAA